MTKLVRGVALLTFVAASGAAHLGHRSLRRAGSRRLSTQVTDYEHLYFFEVMANDTTVTILDSGPFKLEASCKTIRVQLSSTSSGVNFATYEVDDDEESGFTYHDSSLNSTNSYGFGDQSNSTDDDRVPTAHWSSFWTSDVLALELTYTADTDDYVFGPHEWYDNDPSASQLSGSWTAGENRTADIFRSEDGKYGDSFTLQSLSGHYFSIDAGDTAGIHREYSDQLPGGMEAFPEGIECMTAGFITYVVHNDTDAAR